MWCNTHKKHNLVKIYKTKLHVNDFFFSSFLLYCYIFYNLSTQYWWQSLQECLIKIIKDTMSLWQTNMYIKSVSFIYYNFYYETESYLIALVYFKLEERKKLFETYSLLWFLKNKIILLVLVSKDESNSSQYKLYDISDYRIFRSY